MLFYFKKTLFVLEIIKFFYFRLSLFFSLSTIALEDDRILEFRVYDASNYLNKNSITRFVCYLEKEKRYDTETLSIDGISNKEHFYEKSCRKYALKASPRPL